MKTPGFYPGLQDVKISQGSVTTLVYNFCFDFLEWDGNEGDTFWEDVSTRCVSQEKDYKYWTYILYMSRRIYRVQNKLMNQYPDRDISEQVVVPDLVTDDEEHQGRDCKPGLHILKGSS